MPNKNTPTKNRSEAQTHFYVLGDNALSIGGARPVAGDICAATAGEGARGGLHLIKSDGIVYVGHLYRNGNALTLKFPNPNYKERHFPAGTISEILRVECFYYAQATLPCAGARRSARRRGEPAPVVNLNSWKEQHPRASAR
jgi:hypothetical protein